MEGNYEISVSDHTKIVKAVMDHPLQVFRYLDRQPEQRPTHLEVMDAALPVQCFDSETKRLLGIARDAGAQHGDVVASAKGIGS